MGVDGGALLVTAPGFCCFLRAARLLLVDDLEVVIVRVTANGCLRSNVRYYQFEVWETQCRGQKSIVCRSAPLFSQYQHQRKALNNKCSPSHSPVSARICCNLATYLGVSTLANPIKITIISKTILVRTTSAKYKRA